MANHRSSAIHLVPRLMIKIVAKLEGLFQRDLVPLVSAVMTLNKSADLLEMLLKLIMGDRGQ
jgi:hypothetical protein